MTTRFESDVLINTHKKREAATSLKKINTDSFVLNSASYSDFLGGITRPLVFLNSYKRIAKMTQNATVTDENQTKFKVYCLLGEDREFIKVREFETKAELDSFMEGLEEGIGWLEGLWTKNLKEFYRDCLTCTPSSIEDEVERFKADYPVGGESC